MLSTNNNKIAAKMYAMHTSLLYIFGFFLTVDYATGLDLSWIPADGDGPLPLSASYRASLRRLCGMMEGRDGTISPELEEKKAVLMTMCKKLASSDAHTDGGYDAVNTRSALYGIVGLGIIGGSYYLWTTRARSFVTNPLFSRAQSPLSSSGVSNAESMNALREARLKKFS
jgi:hypothetical protein